MERHGGVNDDEAGGGPESGEEPAVPLGVTGDVEDAVTPAAGGALTPWMPPGQGAGEENDLEADGGEPEGTG